MNINDKYEFISDGTWFEKGTKAIVVDNILFKRFEEEGMDIEWDKVDKSEYSGLFEGTHEGEIGQEMCMLDEFTIIKKETL